MVFALEYQLLAFLFNNLNSFVYQGLSFGLIKTALFGMKALAILNSFSV